MKRAPINSKQGAFQTHQSSEEEMIILCHHTHRHQLQGRNTTKDVCWEESRRKRKQRWVECEIRRFQQCSKSAWHILNYMSAFSFTSWSYLLNIRQLEGKCCHHWSRQRMRLQRPPKGWMTDKSHIIRHLRGVKSLQVSLPFHFSLNTLIQSAKGRGKENATDESELTDVK